MASSRNEYLDAGFSDGSDGDVGYDSEEGEMVKGGGGGKKSASLERASKRRKYSHTDSEDEEEEEEGEEEQIESLDEGRKKATGRSRNIKRAKSDGEEDDSAEEDQRPGTVESAHDEADADADSAAPVTITTTQQTSGVGQSNSSNITSTKKGRKGTPREQKEIPGVIYLSTLPPYLRPSALRNLLTQRGFEPVTRLFLTPASKASSTSKKNSRQLYSEGWIEFANKKVARRCAETLNATTVGGKKGGFYRDDLWNMRYLKGLSWDELMAGVREERREEENRRDEERRIISREAAAFLDGVESGKMQAGMKRKKKEKNLNQNQNRPGMEREGDAGTSTGGDGGPDDDDDDLAHVPDQVKRTWRQFEVHGQKRDTVAAEPKSTKAALQRVDDDVKRVLGKIF